MIAPLVRTAPALEAKLARLTRAAQHDLACACGDGPHRTRGPNGLWIYPAALPSGRRIPMLKVLQASGCERACAYCAERLGGSDGGLVLAPDDLARSFVELHRRAAVFGLFLSSAIRGGAVQTMDRILATAELLRGRYGFRGYLHLKIIPGCEPAQVEQAMALGTRVSVNMEAPTAVHLARVAPAKRFDDDILAPMIQISRAEAGGSFDRAGQTTQLVVGAAGESDREIASATAWLYGELRLARVYFSALQPLAGTPLAGRPPVPFLREHRLYQVDFLLRQYGFTLGDLEFDPQGMLPLDVDPKTSWARRHPERFPLEVNTAAAEELLRVPGLGPRAVRGILAARRRTKLRRPESLGTTGASWRIAAPYLLFDGRQAPEQLGLFDGMCARPHPAD